MKIKFFLKGSGRSPVEEFLKQCPASIQTDFFDAVVLLSAGDKLSMPLSRNLSSVHQGLHELRLKDSSGQFRFFYFVKKRDGIYFLYGIRKKTQTLPKKEIDLILKRIKGV